MNLGNTIKELFKKEASNVFRIMTLRTGDKVANIFVAFPFSFLVLVIYLAGKQGEFGLEEYIVSYLIFYMLIFIFLLIGMFIMEIPNLIFYKNVNTLIERIENVFNPEYRSKLKMVEKEEITQVELKEYFKDEPLPSKITLKVWSYKLKRYHAKIVLASGALGGGFLVFTKLLESSIHIKPGVDTWFASVIMNLMNDGLLIYTIQVGVFVFVLYNITGKLFALNRTVSELEILSEIIDLRES